MQFTGKLDQIEVRFQELERQLSDPVVLNDGAEYRKAAKAHSELSDIVASYREGKKASGDLAQARAMLSDSDADLRQMAHEEIAHLEQQLAKIEEHLKLLLPPNDPHDEH